MDSRYVLIVEDDALLRELLATALESWAMQFKLQVTLLMPNACLS